MNDQIIQSQLILPWQRVSLFHRQMTHLVPEEEGRWVVLNDIDEKELTPFARHLFKESIVGIGK